jgi:hypothetical protein
LVTDSHPTPDQFKEILRGASTLDKVVQNYLFSGVPFAFVGNESDYANLIAHVTAGLALREGDMTLVGSGRIGFSLSPVPGEFGRAFGDESDLDLVIVSAELFDVAWLELIGRVPRYYKLPALVKQWHADHVRHVYYGRIWPAKLNGVLSCSPRWSSVLSSAGVQHPSLAARDINGLLYRTWEHALAYHAYGLRQILRHVNDGDY